MSLPWMPLYIGSYLKKTSHLCAAEHGAYLLLIMHYWQNEGLPTDDRHLAGIARMTLAEWKKYKPTIAAFFRDGWKHDKIDVELRASTEAYERRARAGQKGGNAKAKLSAAQSKPNGMHVAEE